MFFVVYNLFFILQDDNTDLSFLKEIREVTGYVLVSHVNIRRIVLPNLMIIRGRNLFKLNPGEEEYALLVARNTIEILELPALRGLYMVFMVFHVISKLRVHNKHLISILVALFYSLHWLR